MLSLFFKLSMRRFCAWVDTVRSYEPTSIVNWLSDGLEHRFNVHVDIRDVRFFCPCLVCKDGPNRIPQITRLAWTEGAEADSVKVVGMVQAVTMKQVRTWPAMDRTGVSCIRPELTLRPSRELFRDADHTQHRTCLLETPRHLLDLPLCARHLHKKRSTTLRLSGEPAKTWPSLPPTQRMLAAMAAAHLLNSRLPAEIAPAFPSLRDLRTAKAWTRPGPGPGPGPHRHGALALALALVLLHARMHGMQVLAWAQDHKPKSQDSLGPSDGTQGILSG